MNILVAVGEQNLHIYTDTHPHTQRERGGTYTFTQKDVHIDANITNSVYMCVVVVVGGQGSTLIPGDSTDKSNAISLTAFSEFSDNILLI